MTEAKTKEIFEITAESLEMSVEQVISKYKAGDADVVKWVKIAVKMHA